MQNIDEAAVLTTGVYVVSVDKDSGAEHAGIQRKDIIILLEAYEITDVTDLTRALRSFYAGDTTSIVLYRSGEKITRTIIFDAK